MKGLCRTLGFLALVAAFVVMVVDGATMISSRQLDLTSLGQLVQLFARAGTLERMGEVVSRAVHPLFWGGIEVIALSPPAVLVLALAGLGLLRVGRRAEPEIVLRMRGG